MKKSWCNNLLPAAVALAFAGATACSGNRKDPAQSTVPPADTMQTNPVTIGPVSPLQESADSAATLSNTGGAATPKGAESGKMPATEADKNKAGASGGGNPGLPPSGSGGKTDGKVIQPPPSTHTGPGQSVKHRSPDQQRLDSIKNAKMKRKE